MSGLSRRAFSLPRPAWPLVAGGRLRVEATRYGRPVDQPAPDTTSILVVGAGMAGLSVTGALASGAMPSNQL